MTLALTILGAVAAGWLCNVLGIPAGSLIGPMVVVAAVKLSGTGLPDVPSTGKFGAFVVLGWLLGQDIEPTIVRTLASTVKPILITVAVLLVTGACLAWFLYTIGGIDKVTAFLATSPGGVTQMAALAADSGADVGLVVGLHLVRIVAVVLVTPVVVRLLSSS